MTGEGADPSLDLPDIQGNILRGYRSRETRHFLLRIPDVELGRAFVRALLPASAADPGLHVSDATFATSPPEYCLNLAFSWLGLEALGVDPDILAAFPAAFRLGAAARSRESCDTGESGPENWLFGTDEEPVHVIASLSFHPLSEAFAPDLEWRLERVIRDAGMIIIGAQPPLGRWLPADTVHFGYREGIGQPWILGSPGPARGKTMQLGSPPGDFILSPHFRNSQEGRYIRRIDPRIATHGTYGVFRMLEQDTERFDRYLDATAARLGESKKWLMAKLMGRWREGPALSAFPEPPTVLPADSDLDNFDYRKPPAPFDDSAGERCPIGAHSRRLYPRNQAVAGGLAMARRIIRRGLPYGPEFAPGQEPDGEPRGLVGYFFCGDIQEQFEFVVREWGNRSIFTPGIRDTQDPFVGNFDSGAGRFHIPVAGKPTIVLEDLPRVVRTNGAVNTFLPGFRALRYLADGTLATH